MSNRITKLLVAGFAVLIMAMPLAQARHEGGYGHKGWKADLDDKFFYKAHFVLAHAEQLGLSDEQIETIRNLKYDVKKSLVQQKADIKVVKLDIKQKMHGKTFDTEAINQLIDQKYELKKTKAKYLVGALAQLKGALTDEQYEKMKDLKTGQR